LTALRPIAGSPGRTEEPGGAAAGAQRCAGGLVTVPAPERAEGEAQDLERQRSYWTARALAGISGARGG